MKKRDTWGTIEYFKRYTWKGLNRRTVNGSSPQFKNKANASYFKKGIRLEITKSELDAFCEANKQLILELYEKGTIPTIDRINSNDHYRLDNIRILSRSDNCKKL